MEMYVVLDEVFAKKGKSCRSRGRCDRVRTALAGEVQVVFGCGCEQGELRRAADSPGAYGAAHGRERMHIADRIAQELLLALIECEPLNGAF
jgi:hypothetical protein